MSPPASAHSSGFAHRHILGIEGMSPADITALLDLSEAYVEQNRAPEKK